MGLLLSLVFFLLRIVRVTLDFISDIVYKILYENLREIKLPKIQDEILLMPATKLAEKIRSQELKSQDVVQSFINRINAVNGITKAVVDTRFEEALGTFINHVDYLLTKIEHSLFNSFLNDSNSDNL